jgi:acyl carrier protein
MTPDARVAFPESPLDCIRAVVADHYGCPIESLTIDTRIDDLEQDDLRTIDLMSAIESRCGCDTPDYQITTIMTLGQLAVLVEQTRKSES